MEFLLVLFLLISVFFIFKFFKKNMGNDSVSESGLESQGSVNPPALSARKLEIRENISLASAISSAVRSETLTSMLLSFLAFKIDIDLKSELAKEGADLDSIMNLVQSSIIKRIDVDRFNLMFMPHLDYNYWFDELERTVSLIENIMADMINSGEANWMVTKEYLPALKRIRLRTVTTNKWGDLDTTEWADNLAEFTKEKFVPSDSFELFEDIPEEMYLYLKTVNLHSLYPRFAHYAFESLCQLDTTSTDFLIETGEDFELYIKHLLETNLAGIVVETTPKTGDHGADLLLSWGECVIAIQAKFYSGNVGNGAVQEIYSAKDFYGASYAIVVTNSGYTAAAKQAAEKLGVFLAHDHTIVGVVAALIEEGGGVSFETPEDRAT